MSTPIAITQTDLTFAIVKLATRATVKLASELVRTSIKPYDNLMTMTKAAKTILKACTMMLIAMTTASITRA